VQFIITCDLDDNRNGCQTGMSVSDPIFLPRRLATAGADAMTFKSAFVPHCF
jgi:hypothetical protein